VPAEVRLEVSACTFGWFVWLRVRKEVLLAGLGERKILFQLKIYDRLRQATNKPRAGNRFPPTVESEI